MEEDEEEVYKEADIEEGASTADLAPKQALAPWATVPIPPGLWQWA